MMKFTMEFETAEAVAEFFSTFKGAPKEERRPAEAAPQPQRQALKTKATKPKANTNPAKKIRSHRRWSKKEDRFLIANWSKIGKTCTTRDLAATLGRSISGTQYRITLLRNCKATPKDSA